MKILLLGLLGLYLPLTAVYLLATLCWGHDPQSAGVTLAFYCSVAVWTSCFAATKMPSKRTASLVTTLAIILSNLSLALIRSCYDPIAVLGAIPPSIEPWVYSGIALFTTLLSLPVTIIWAKNNKKSMTPWILTVVMTAGTWGLLFFAYQQSTKQISNPTDLLRAIVNLEGNDGAEWELSVYLAMVGEERNARDLVPSISDGEAPQIKSKLKSQSWKDALEKIAQSKRVVLIMEAHHISEHRAFIRQALPIFHKHGFRRYAAEGLFEPGSTLRGRAYPSYQTGYYTLDPQFANLIRDALHLGFEPIQYDSGATMEQREEQQAKTLAAAIKDAPEGKILIHVGFHHLLKYQTKAPDSLRWMASRLWEKTGIEPFTIYQLSSGTTPIKDSPDYHALVKKIGSFSSPMLISPVPQGLVCDPFFNYPKKGRARAVDALLIHPPLRRKSSQGRPNFIKSNDRQQINGRLLGGSRPVIVSAKRAGASADELPLDQIILRENSNDFELWIPKNTEVKLQVHGLDGQMQVSESKDENLRLLKVSRR